MARRPRFLPENEDGVLVEITSRTIGARALLTPGPNPRRFNEVVVGVLGRAQTRSSRSLRRPDPPLSRDSGSAGGPEPALNAEALASAQLNVARRGPVYNDVGKLGQILDK